MISAGKIDKSMYPLTFSTFDSGTLVHVLNISVEKTATLLEIIAAISSTLDGLLFLITMSYQSQEKGRKLLY